jgi:SOS regulatory protein LexA
MPKNYQKILAKFYSQHKRLPSYRQFMTVTGLKSTNAVHKIFAKLIEARLLSRDRNGKLSPGQKLLGQTPILGVVEAGFPSPAEEELIDTISLDDYLIRRKEATYILQVSGDSMIEAGIVAGDLALVERGPEPRDHDIVIAEVDQKWTMKYFRKQNGKVFLQAANKKYPNFYPTEELRIAAVVRAIIRKYK